MRLGLSINFDRYTEPECLMRGGLIVRSMTGNPRFPEPWHANVPPLARITAGYQRYEAAAHAALASRDPAKIAERNAARADLVEMFHILASYLELEANGDREALLSTGFELRGGTPRAAPAGLLPAPADFRVKHGPRSGTLDLHCTRSEGAGGYEAAYTTGDPTIEANWLHAATSTSSMHILVENLTPTQIVYVRLRAFNLAGYGAWTEPVRIIVV